MSVDPVTFLADGRVSVEVESAAEAKLAVKMLKLKKREIAAAKKQVTGEMARIRAEHQSRVAQRGSKVRGRKGLLGLVNIAQTIQRDGDRRDVDGHLQPLRVEAERLQAAMLRIDDSILKLEGYILNPARAQLLLKQARDGLAGADAPPHAVAATKGGASPIRLPSVVLLLTGAVVVALVSARIGGGSPATSARSSSQPNSSAPVSPSIADLRSGLFVNGRLQVARFAEVATNRTRVAELLGGEVGCSKSVGPHGTIHFTKATHYSQQSCSYQDSRTVVAYAFEDTGQIPISVSLLDPTGIAFDAKALQAFGVVPGQLRERTETTLRWAGVAPLSEVTIYRNVTGQIMSVDFEFAR